MTMSPNSDALTIGQVRLAVAAMDMVAHLLAIGPVAMTVVVTTAVLPLGINQSALVIGAVVSSRVSNARHANAWGMLLQTAIC
jgi:hypothetical protein